MPADRSNPIPAPTTRVRFSSEQLKPIFMGLDDLVRENIHVRATGSLRRHPNLSDEFGRYGSHETPKDEQMSALLSAHTKIQPRIETDGWLRLDHRELAACALAVSHAKWLIRKKHIQMWTANYEKVAKRLQQTIEMFRKRAIKQIPISQQKAEREKIVADLRSVRQRLQPAAKSSKQPRCLRMNARDVIARAVKLAIDGLQLRGFERPEDTSTVRLKIRACLRNLARRGTTRNAILEDNISASLMLADYVIRHSTALVRCKRADEPSTLRTEPARAFSHIALTCTTDLNSPSPAGMRKEPPAHVRIACSEVEWLMMENLNGESGWSTMSRFARVDAIAKAKEAGGKDLSNRHIARIIGVDDKTVARMLKEAALPKKLRSEMLSGNKSGNRALRESTDPVLQQAKRIARDKTNGSVSTQHAEQICKFVQGIALGNTPRLAVQRAKDLLRAMDPLQFRAVVPSWTPEEVIEEAKRLSPRGRDLNDIEILAQRLARWLRKVAPEPEIHRVALDKALGLLPRGGVWGAVS